MGIPRVVADSIKNPAITHYRITDITIQYFATVHASGNIDVFYNGVLLLPEIPDNIGTYSNFSAVYYDYQSGTAIDTAGTNWVAATTADTPCSHIKMAFTFTLNDILSIRSY